MQRGRTTGRFCSGTVVLRRADGALERGRRKALLNDEITEAHLEKRMNARAGIVLAGAMALTMGVSAVPVTAQELSEGAVKSFMDYAWSLTPQQFSRTDGTVIQIDKKKKDEVMIPVDVARDVIKAGRLSAHAQVCNLREDQVENHRALMRREDSKKKWTPQQMVYISQLHLTTVMLLTGKIKLVEKQGDKEVVVDEGKARPAQSCTEEQGKKVKEMIATYVAASPVVPRPPVPAVAGTPAPAATGATAVPKTAATPAPAAPKP
jgi:hypothetical protein